MLTFTFSQGKQIATWLEKLRDNVQIGVELPVKEVLLHISTPREIQALYDSCRSLEQVIADDRSQGGISISDDFGPLIKLALLTARRPVASGIEIAKRNTLNTDIIDSLDARLEPFDELMNQDWFISTDSLRRPQLTDFLTLGQAELIFQERAKLPERTYDEKFHILQAPALMLHDLTYYRDCCERRGTSVALAYLDIDRFKEFNTKYGETTVDRFLLPRFMAELEAFVFGRGFAYRYGGDEYVVLLPSLDLRSAIDTLNELRTRLSKLRFHAIEDGVTVSIGLCALDPQCFLTGSEAEQRAERAKNFAKREGKNRLATYTSPLFREEDLHVPISA